MSTHADLRPSGAVAPPPSGWWVPQCQYEQQTLLPHTGAWQKVRCANGLTVEACRLAGRIGWWDGNYRPVDNVQMWFKPGRWFHDPEDLEGRVNELAAYRLKIRESSSPLRS